MSVSINESNTQDEKIDINFDSSDHDEPQSVEQTKDLSKYTLVDHLDEDEPINGQQYCLFSFLSPEGVMNCNVRAVKFRGAYPTIELATQKARELEKRDKYFKIFIGESGKWLDFDPPESRVEREMTSNDDYQQILDAQRKQRLDQMNKLAGKFKESVDKRDTSKQERINETKKASGASNAINRRNEQKIEPHEHNKNKTLDRIRKRLAEKRSSEQKTDDLTVANDNIANLKQYVKDKQAKQD